MNRRAVLVGAAMLVAFAGVGAPAAGQEREIPLALKGYDPVAYFTEARATPGDSRFQYAWDGAIYRFASAAHRDMFMADPDRYLPQYGNLCTASLANGRRYTPDPRNWLVHEGRLYLFGQPAGKLAMSADPSAMKAKADANWITLVRPAVSPAGPR